MKQLFAVVAVLFIFNQPSYADERGELFSAINGSLKEELSICGDMNGLCAKTLEITRKRNRNAESHIKALEKELSLCLEARLITEKQLTEKEEESGALRRRLAGQKNILSAVLAAGGTALFLLLL